MDHHVTYAKTLAQMTTNPNTVNTDLKTCGIFNLPRCGSTLSPSIYYYAAYKVKMSKIEDAAKQKNMPVSTRNKIYYFKLPLI